MTHTPRTQPIDTLVFLGDSLTAGYGLAQCQAYPALFAVAARARGLAIEVLNAGVSGDTTADGARRTPALLRARPTWMIVALGANDMFRGVPVAGVRANLERILESCRAQGTRPILFGMEAAPIHGWDYMEGFDCLFPELAAKWRVPLLPFFIRDVALRPELNLPDLIHPNARGQAMIAERVTEFLVPMLAADAAPGAGSLEGDFLPDLGLLGDAQRAVGLQDRRVDVVQIVDSLPPEQGA